MIFLPPVLDVWEDNLCDEFVNVYPCIFVKQERLWKLTAAAQICHRVAFTSRLRIEEKQQQWGLKKVAHTLANAVNQFWHSAETLLNSDDSSDCIINDNLIWSKVRLLSLVLEIVILLLIVEFIC